MNEKLKKFNLSPEDKEEVYDYLTEMIGKIGPINDWSDEEIQNLLRFVLYSQK